MRACRPTSRSKSSWSRTSAASARSRVASSSPRISECSDTGGDCELAKEFRSCCAWASGSSGSAISERKNDEMSVVISCDTNIMILIQTSAMWRE